MPEVERAGPVGTLWRGARRRCPRCGVRGIFDGWFRLKERCPRCGYRFRREEGFYTGVYLLNFGAALSLMWAALMLYILWRASSDTDSSLWPVLLVCVGFALFAPVVLYPFASATWAALDLVLRPLEPEEEADAATWAASADDPRDR
jgi:uncharacterized protein (DUF983 family)